MPHVDRTALVLWRDSAAAGDDADAPHEITLSVALDATLADVAERLLGARWLASVSGGHATWILEGARPLAVLAQQWAAPRWLVPPETPAWDVARAGGRPHFEARYWCQADPDRVLDALREGRPLPGTFGD